MRISFIIAIDCCFVGGMKTKLIMFIGPRLMGFEPHLILTKELDQPLAQSFSLYHSSLVKDLRSLPHSFLFSQYFNFEFLIHTRRQQ